MTGFYAILVISLLIALARIADVTIGTLRILYITRQLRLVATLLGFAESLIWLLAVSQIMADLTNYIYFFAFAGGFAMGNYIGMGAI